MVQLKTELKHRWGRANVLPIVGEVEISEEGVIEVESQEVAEQVVSLGVGFDFIEELEEIKPKAEEIKPKTEEIKPKTEESDLNPEGENEEEIKPKTEENEPLNEAPKMSDAEVAQVRNVLGGMTVAQLKEKVKDFPSAEWRSLNKAELIEYLITKL